MADRGNQIKHIHHSEKGIGGNGERKMYINSSPVHKYVQSITWSGSARQAPRTIEFSLLYSPLDPNIGTPTVKLGDRVTLYEGETMLFYGYVTSRERTSEAGTLSYTAKDKMMYLLRSKGTYKFTNKTPEQIAKNVCADVKMGTKGLAKTKHKIDKAFFSERPLYEIIMAGYTAAHRKNGKMYIAQMNGRKFAVIEKGKIIQKFKLKQGERIISSTLSETTDNMVNRVAIYDSGNRKIGTISNDKWAAYYGVYQEALTVDSGNGKKEAKNMLIGKEKEATVSCLGDVRCVSGRGVLVEDTKTGLNGFFWIESDSHTWDADGSYIMELNLAFKNFMDEQEFDEENETTETGTGETSGGTGILNGRKVRAKFTAYYPANNSLQGGFMDAFDTPLSHYLNNGINMVAAPPSIPKDTQIQILETGTNRDGGVYVVRDRGGAIQIEPGDVYHFDILTPDHNTAYSWGVKMGYAIIGDGTGFSQGSTMAAGNSVIEKATAQMEAWANNNVHGYSQQSRWGPDYDCSSAIIQAWELAGIPVKSRGATYTGNMMDVFPNLGFKIVTASCNLANGAGMQRGDVLLNTAHHTAMYCGNGRMVHARGQSYGSSASGDQGQEFAITPYSNYPWNYVLRYGG